MENTYYVNLETIPQNVEVLYERLFRGFEFSTSLSEAEVVVIPSGVSPIKKEIATLYLAKPQNEDLGCESFSDDKGNKVWVSYSTNLAVSEEIIVFLNSKGFYSNEDGELEVIPHISELIDIRPDSFMANLITSSYELVSNDVDFQDYITFLVERILGVDYSSMAKQLVETYLNEFYVAFTARDYATDNACNMETREFVGDRVAWSSMTNYFLRRFPARSARSSEDEGLNQNQMTCLHRDYCSKEVQASISFDLFLYKFIRTSSRVTKSAHEDLFEALVGTLYEISFRERVKGTSSIKLHELFLTKLYDSFEITPNDNKPSVTEFSEMMVSLTCTNGDSKNDTKRKLYKINGSEKREVSVFVSRQMKDVLLEKLDDTTKVNALLQLLRTRRSYNQMNKASECDIYFKQLIRGITNIVGHEVLNDLQNLKSITLEQLGTLKAILTRGQFVCHLKNVEKNWSDSFWELEYDGNTYSTKDLPNPDMFETLVGMFEQSKDAPSSNNEQVEDIFQDYLDTRDTDFVVISGTKYGIKPNTSVYQVRRFLTSNSDAKLFTTIFGKNIDCSTNDILRFKAQFHRFVKAIRSDFETSEDYVGHICELLGRPGAIRTNCSSDLYEFIGNRMVLTFGNRIFYSLLPGASEYHLDSYQKYYTSKVVKREIARMMKCPEEMSLDELLGRLDEYLSESLINLIYLNLVISDADCFNYAKEVNRICNLMEPPPIVPSAKPIDAKTKPKTKNYFMARGNDYCFAFKDIAYKVSFKNKNYSWIRVIFEREVYLHLLRVFGGLEVSALLNRKFKNNATYNKLSLLLKHRGYTNFSINMLELKCGKRFQLRIAKEPTRGSDESLKFESFIFDTLDEAYAKLSNT
jgi:dsRNA-specific ribonuclease